jgi:hypothetical protein
VKRQSKNWKLRSLLCERRCPSQRSSMSHDSLSILRD